MSYSSKTSDFLARIEYECKAHNIESCMDIKTKFSFTKIEKLAFEDLELYDKNCITNPVARKTLDEHWKKTFDQVDKTFANRMDKEIAVWDVTHNQAGKNLQYIKNSQYKIKNAALKSQEDKDASISKIEKEFEVIKKCFPTERSEELNNIKNNVIEHCINIDINCDVATYIKQIIDSHDEIYNKTISTIKESYFFGNDEENQIVGVLHQFEEQLKHQILPVINELCGQIEFEPKSLI